MDQAAAGFLKIVIFLIIGILFRKSGVLNNRGIEGVKIIVLYLAIPSVLFLSFSRLDFNLSLLPVTITVFSINFLLFWLGVLIYKITGSNNRLLPLCLSTMNFGLLGIPLFEAVYGIDNLHHYTMFGMGNEIFIWFVFYFLLRWFLSDGEAETKINRAFFKSPVIWGIILGCIFSILHIDISNSSNFLILGISHTLNSAAKLTTPLILIFIGFNISLSFTYLKQSFKYLLLRLSAAFALGYILKAVLLDQFIVNTVYYNSAYFLLISLPPMFSIPILAADYLENNELKLLNNIIVLHSVVTIIMFAVFTLTYT